MTTDTATTEDLIAANRALRTPDFIYADYTDRLLDAAVVETLRLIEGELRRRGAWVD